MTKKIKENRIDLTDIYTEETLGAVKNVECAAKSAERAIVKMQEAYKVLQGLMKK